MKPILTFAGLVIYNIYLFFVNDVRLLAFLAAIEIFCTLLVARRGWRGWWRFVLANSGFVIFVVLCNLLFLETTQALVIGARLWLAIGST